MRVAIQTFNEARAECRTKLFLVATMTIAQSSMECRIRNLSNHGALLEASTAVSAASTIVVNRGQLSVAGQAVWCRDGLIGIRFATTIDVQAWLSEATDQQKRGSKLPQKVSKAAETRTKSRKIDNITIDSRLGEEIAIVARTIGLVSELLVKDPVLRMRHETSLQQLAISHEVLRDIAIIVREGRSAATIESVVRGPLRQRIFRT